jgi:hypothetical protein
MKPLVFVVASLSVLAAAPRAEAQNRWVLELRTGPAFPIDESEGLELTTGFGFEGTAAVRIHYHAFAYAGWDWHRFALDAAPGGGDFDLEETGYAFGIRFEHPLSGEFDHGPALRFHAGGTYNHIELEDSEGELVADSGHGLGWETGAAVVVPLGDALRLSPGLRFRSVSRDLTMESTNMEIDLRYLAAELGVAWSID